MKSRTRFGWGGFCAWLMWGAAWLLSWSSPWGLSAQTRATPQVVRVQLHSGITQATTAYVDDALAHAAQVKADALVIELDTPGGLLESTRQIVQALLKSQVPVVVWVAPAGARAGSAGVFITLAAHVAVMTPTSNIGAAHPVSSFGGDVQGAMGDKVVSDTAAWARSLAETHGRNAEWAAQAVKESVSATASEALALGVIDLVARDLPELLDSLHGRTLTLHDQPHVLRTAGARVTDFERTGKQRLYEALASPSLMYILLLVGLLGLYLEFQSPGLIVPGALGALCLVLVFGTQSLPMNSIGIVLLVAGLVLFALEAYVTSFGILAVAGTAALIVGSYLLFDVPGSSFRLDPILIWSVGLVFATLALGLAAMVMRVRLQGASSGPEALAGSLAEVRQDIGPGVDGKVFLDGSFWNARSERRLPAGTMVRVERFEGLIVHVVPVDTTPRDGTSDAAA